MNNKYPLLEVEWIDAASCPHGIHSLADVQAHSGAKARTVGYLLKKDKQFIVLAMTHFYETTLPETEVAEEGFRFIWTIPRGCVKEIRFL